MPLTLRAPRSHLPANDLTSFEPVVDPYEEEEPLTAVAGLDAGPGDDPDELTSVVAKGPMPASRTPPVTSACSPHVREALFILPQLRGAADREDAMGDEVTMVAERPPVSRPPSLSPQVEPSLELAQLPIDVLTPSAGIAPELVHIEAAESTGGALAVESPGVESPGIDVPIPLAFEERDATEAPPITSEPARASRLLTLVVRAVVFLRALTFFFLYATTAAIRWLLHSSGADWARALKRARCIHPLDPDDA